MSDYTDGLRALADFLDTHPLNTPLAFTAYDFVHRGDNATADDVLAAFQAKAASLGDDVKLSSTGGHHNASLMFGPHKLEVTVAVGALRKDPPPPGDHPLSDLLGAK